MNPITPMDLILGAALIGIAWNTLIARDLFRGVVLFIMFGLIMAVTWSQLHAPDVALTEAALGAGLMGSLLLRALRGMTAPDPDAQDQPATAGLWGYPLAFGLAAGIGLALLSLPDDVSGLAPRVLAHLEESGVRHPLTAVLLNFRGYDTLLEIGVLLAGALAVRAAGHPPEHASAPSDPVPSHPVLAALTRLLIPSLVLLAGWLLWAGAFRPGGAFQAGCVLGAAGILLVLAGRLPDTPGWSWPLALGLASGLAVFLAAAGLGLATQGALLAYPRAQAGLWILVIEAALAIAIGITIVQLYLGPPMPAGTESDP